MDETKTELVKVYDFITRETTTIPASELTAGMVRIQIDGSDEIVWADSAQLKQGALRHPPFGGALREKILYVQQSLADVYPGTYEFWEDGFRRDLHAEQQIDLWVSVCRCFDSFSEQDSLTAEERREAFQILVACLNTTPSTVFETVSVRALDRSVAQQLADAFFYAIGHG
jgi:hypothetical protein